MDSSGRNHKVLAYPTNMLRFIQYVASLLQLIFDPQAGLEKT